MERKHINFLQAEGILPLPRQLSLKEIPVSTKSKLWAIFFTFLKKNRYSYSSIVIDEGYEVAYDFHVFALHRMADEFDNSFGSVVNTWKYYFSEDSEYFKTLWFVEWFLRRCENATFDHLVSKVLIEERCAYRLVEGRSIVPIASEIEGVTLTSAVSDLSDGSQEGARVHLQGAISALNAGKYAESVRESIHAVEAILRNQTKKNTFSEAIKELATVQRIHPALKLAIEKLYAYTNDENGIRHSLIDDGTAPVTESVALFMLGTVASFVTFVKRGYEET